MRRSVAVKSFRHDREAGFSSGPGFYSCHATPWLVVIWAQPHGISIPGINVIGSPTLQRMNDMGEESSGTSGRPQVLAEGARFAGGRYAIRGLCRPG